MTTGGYSFPSADLPEIVSVVQDWGLQDVHQSQIAACDVQVIQSIYALALERVTGITTAALDQATEKSLLPIDEYPVRDWFSHFSGLSLMYVHHGQDICVGGISMNFLLYHMYMQFKFLCFRMIPIDNLQPTHSWCFTARGLLSQRPGPTRESSHSEQSFRYYQLRQVYGRADRFCRFPPGQFIPSIS